MALIIETGAGLADAESFATAAELAAFAVDFGWTIPSGTAEQEALLRRAGVAMWEIVWKGTQLRNDQGLPWPRLYTARRGFATSGSALPRKIKIGQMALACEIYKDDTDPPEQRQGAVVREKVGPIDTEYGAITGYKAKPAAGRQSQALFAPYAMSPGSVRVMRS